MPHAPHKPRRAPRRTDLSGNTAATTAPPIRHDSATGAELADLLGVTPTRIGQLVRAGVITRNADGTFDALLAALALLAHHRRDDAGREARTRALRARGAAIELRVRRDLRNLISIEEFRELVGVIVDRGAEMVRRESQRVYLDCKARLPEAEAVRCASAIHKHELGLVRAIDTGARDLVDHLSREHFAADDRIADRFGELMDAAMLREVDLEELADGEDEVEV